MSMRRFYLATGEVGKTTVSVSDNQLLHQWQRVLRYVPGDEVVLFDGKHADVRYKIVQIQKKQVKLTKIQDEPRRLPNREVSLAWSLLKRENNELIIQKATELGVSRLTPLIADRCIRSDVSKTRSDRWQKIAIEAAEQCGRSDIPKLQEPVTVDEFVQAESGANLLICRIEDAPDQAVLSSTEPVSIAIGPEGGWSEREEQMFQENALQTLPLGQFTLRAETAAIVAVSFLAR